MALFVLIILGISLGWFSSIVARTETPRAILSQMGVGILAALVAGLALNSGSILGGLSHFGLGAGVIAAIVALVLYHAIVTRSQTADAPAE
ncbi:MAG: hypothetical protein HRT64_13665 [Erythrobacter sp.]|nr:hypothetical protein [Erythrobacter sp.]